MRLFVALCPPEPVLDAVEAAVGPPRARWGGLRWARREQWHITLAFYGELAPARLPALTRRLARVARRNAAPRLTVAGAGTFPRAERANVLWAGVGGDERGLRRLADAASAAGRRAGAPADDKAFRPHVTLARCRVPTDLTGAVADLAGLDAGEWQAEELLLIRSHTGPRPTYETLHTWRLGGPPAE